MTFAVEFLPAARRELEALDTTLRRRIDRKIALLAANPRASGSKKLEGHDLMRVRVGDYRIVYAVIDKRLVVLIVRVAHRSRVYRGL